MWKMCGALAEEMPQNFEPSACAKHGILSLATIRGVELMTITGWNLQKELSGIPAIAMELIEKRQSIATTRTFDADKADFEEIRERIVTFTSICAKNCVASIRYAGNSWFSSKPIVQGYG
jgi:hypothetical protein